MPKLPREKACQHDDENGSRADNLHLPEDVSKVVGFAEKTPARSKRQQGEFLDFVKGSIEKAHLLGYCSPTRKTCSTLDP